MAESDIRSQIDTLREDIAKLQEAISSQTAETYEDLRSRAGSIAKSANPAIKSATRYVKSEGAAVGEVAREHPAGLSTVVAAAGLVGIAIGYLLACATQEPPARSYKSYWR